jgi:fibronectin-binding autotransporter adhesin
MKQSLRMFFSALIVVAGSLPCMALNGTWTNLTSGGFWSTNANWAGGTIADGSSYNAVFNLNLTGNNTVHLDGPRTLTYLQFAAGTSAYDWTLDNNEDAANILTLAGSTFTIDVINRTATISAVIAGTVGLSKAGAGTLTLTTTNTYTGPTLVSGGTLILGATSKIAPSSLTVSGASTPTLQLESGARVDNAQMFVIGNQNNQNGAVIQYGGDVTSTLALRLAIAYATTAASYRMNGGTISLPSLSDANSYLQIGRDGAAAFTQAGGTVTLARMDGDAFVMGNNSGAVGAYTNSGGLLSVSGGTGSRIGINGTGILAVNGTGSVNFKGAVSLGDGSGTGTVSFAAGQIRLNTLKKGAGMGTFNWGGGTLSPYDANATVSNSLPLTLTGPDAQFNTQDASDVARTVTVFSAINQSGGSWGLTKNGAGTLTLAGTNTYAGATTVNNGILKFSATGSISNSSRVVVSSGGTCDVSAVTGFTVLPNQTLMGNGVVTGAVTVAAGGILGGTGTVASVVTNNGVITAGETNTVGILTLTNLVMAGDSTYVWNYSDTAQDLINVKGTLSLPNVATVMVSKISGSLPSGAVLFKCGSSGTPDGTTLSSWVIIGARPDSKAVVRTVASQKQVQLVSPTGMILRLY